ncbi:hypothetical protein U0070_017032 [Myodes glareolus]|uniref:Uncharacterized protein n=1 Tax=Myodes glareolus TaxID=447135 RepID=A0AAW0HQM5_MYOGA
MSTGSGLLQPVPENVSGTVEIKDLRSTGRGRHLLKSSTQRMRNLVLSCREGCLPARSPQLSVHYSGYLSLAKITPFPPGGLYPKTNELVLEKP